ncbi:MAG: NfeD family protein [Verrucomicrobia bacterium]|nr:NfeD family protein [Verrucomicrobiota bacterium]
MDTVITWRFMGASLPVSTAAGDLAGWVVGALILAGAALLLLETVLPGLIAGVLGLICLLSGVIVGYAKFGAPTGNLILLGVSAGLVVGTLAWMKYFPSSRIAKVFVSETTVGDLGVEKPELLNQTGVTHTNLRPSGTAVINGRRVDVVTEGSMIDRGTPVRVIAVEGLRVVVRAIENP